MMLTFKKTTMLLAILMWCGLTVHAQKIPDVLPDPDGKEADMNQKVKVFILMGQSNMLGFGKVGGSLETAVKQKKLYPYLVDDDGNWTTRKDVRNVRVMCSGGGPWKTHLNQWMSIQGNGRIGPEHGIGHYVGHVLDAPVLILKSCIGNRALSWDLVPPTSDMYQGNKAMPRKPKEGGGGWYAGLQYDGDVRAALEVLQDLNTYYPGAKGYEVAGFFFWQGAKDSGNGGWADAYEKNLVELVKSLRMDFKAPNAPFVCATLGEAKKGGGGNKGKITAAQLAVDGRTGKYPEFKDTVRTFYSNPVCKGSSANGHYGGNAETYMNVGEGMGKLMAELLVANMKVARPKPAKPGQPRPSRELPDESYELLRGALLKTLVKLSSDGKLKKIRVPMKGTKRQIWLKGADEDGTLTYQMMESKRSAKFQMDKLTSYDHAHLAKLVTKLKPESKDALAVAGVLFEVAGKTTTADEYFEKAGESSTNKFEKLFKR